MKVGIFFLVLAYVLSQFYRAFLAVLSPVLALDIGAGPQDLALSSGLWFLTFAAMQIPVGVKHWTGSARAAPPPGCWPWREAAGRWSLRWRRRPGTCIWRWR